MTEANPTATDRSRALREQIIPLPSYEDGYARAMLVGTTGAGKTTLLRHLIGTDPHRDRFPSTSTAKTTTADIEIVTADGPFEAVVTFASRDQVQADVEDCLYEAAQRVIQGESEDSVAGAFLEHPDQRFRLSYILGAWNQALPDGPSAEQGALDDYESGYGDPDETAPDIASDEIVGAEAVGRNNEALRTFVSQVIELARDLGEAIGDRWRSYDKLTNERERTEWLSEVFAPALRDNADFIDLANDVMSAIQERFGMMPVGEFGGDEDREGWRSHWRFADADREAFLRQVRWFSSNHHKQFGQLLTPLVDGVRVRGPFFPSHADLSDDKLRLVLLDGEGLGHSPKEVTSVSTKVTDRFADVDFVLLVDNAQQPMQAAPMKLIQTVGASGYSSKLAVAFTHFDQVKGDNLRSFQEKSKHVHASVTNALVSLHDAMSPRVSETLRARFDDHTYLYRCVGSAGVENPITRCRTDARPA